MIVRTVAAIGRPVVAAARAARDLWLVTIGVLAGVIRQFGRGARRPRRAREPRLDTHRRGASLCPRGAVAAQLYAIGNRSLVFVIVTLGFIGMVMIYQACLQFSRAIGDLSQVGMQFLRLAVSDFGPTLTGMMLATRVGAGIAAEIGSMKVTEQIDALRMSGVLPIDYLLVPRFLACIVMTVVLTIVGTAVMFGAGGMTAYLSFGVNPRTFFDPAMVMPRHLILGLVKAVAYGAAIPIVSGFCGLRARGSSEGVGWATTAAVVGSSFAVIALDFGLSVGALWLLGGKL